MNPRRTPAAVNGEQNFVDIGLGYSETLTGLITAAGDHRGRGHATQLALLGPPRPVADTALMTAATKIERSGPAIRAALAEAAPADCDRFEREFRQALARAESDFDLASIERVLDRWWGIAAIRANPLSPAERDQVARARAGDETGWIVHRDDGTRTRL